MNRLKQGVGMINRVVTFLEHILLTIAGICLIGMLATVCIGVGSRAILGNSILWTNELASYLLLGTVFLAAPWVLRNNAHIVVDLFTHNLKGRLLKLNTLMVAIVGATASAIYFYFSFTNMWGHYLAGTINVGSFPWPRFALFIPMVVGFLFLVIRFLTIILTTSLHINQKDAPAPPTVAPDEEPLINTSLK